MQGEAEPHAEVPQAGVGVNREILDEVWLEEGAAGSHCGAPEGHEVASSVWGPIEVVSVPHLEEVAGDLAVVAILERLDRQQLLQGRVLAEVRPHEAERVEGGNGPEELADVRALVLRVRLRQKHPVREQLEQAHRSHQLVGAKGVSTAQLQEQTLDVGAQNDGHPDCRLDLGGDQRHLPPRADVRERRLAHHRARERDGDAAQDADRHERGNTLGAS
mmetsp:Transcript_18751/g.58951  ORF Transcript_18751/g.58951 Transcript_18751/m.58951 type:complete len:218 (-) Transcript_18751:370-1023(-)